MKFIRHEEEDYKELKHALSMLCHDNADAIKMAATIFACWIHNQLEDIYRIQISYQPHLWLHHLIKRPIIFQYGRSRYKICTPSDHKHGDDPVSSTPFFVKYDFDKGHFALQLQIEKKMQSFEITPEKIKIWVKRCRLNFKDITLLRCKKIKSAVLSKQYLSFKLPSRTEQHFRTHGLVKEVDPSKTPLNGYFNNVAFEVYLYHLAIDSHLSRKIMRQLFAEWLHQLKRENSFSFELLQTLPWFLRKKLFISNGKEHCYFLPAPIDNKPVMFDRRNYRQRGHNININVEYPPDKQGWKLRIQGRFKSHHHDKTFFVTFKQISDMKRDYDITTLEPIDEFAERIATRTAIKVLQMPAKNFKPPPIIKGYIHNATWLDQPLTVYGCSTILQNVVEKLLLDKITKYESTEIREALLSLKEFYNRRKALQTPPDFARILFAAIHHEDYAYAWLESPEQLPDSLYQLNLDMEAPWLSKVFILKEGEQPSYFPEIPIMKVWPKKKEICEEISETLKHLISHQILITDHEMVARLSKKPKNKPAIPQRRRANSIPGDKIRVKLVPRDPGTKKIYHVDEMIAIALN